jgi:hypothetical protein
MNIEETWIRDAQDDGLSGGHAGLLGDVGGPFE